MQIYTEGGGGGGEGSKIIARFTKRVDQFEKKTSLIYTVELDHRVGRSDSTGRRKPGDGDLGKHIIGTYFPFAKRIALGELSGALAFGQVAKWDDEDERWELINLKTEKR